MKFVYPYTTEPDSSSIFVTFPDVPEALTQVEPDEDFEAIVHDCLVAALRGRVEDREALPTPSPPKGRPTLALDALESVKLALFARMQEKRVTNVALASRLGVAETVVRRLLDLDHRSHIGQLENALKILGQRMVISVKAA